MLFYPIILAAIMALTPNLCNGSSDESKVALSAGLGLNSRYIWRGWENDDSPVAQPYLDIEITGITAEASGNLDLESPSGEWEWNELDFSLAAAFSLNNLTLEPSLQLYTYPHLTDSPTTGEAVLSAYYDLCCGASLQALFALDYMEYAGSGYGEAGLAWEGTLGVIPLSTALSAGWGSSEFMQGYFEYSRSTLTNIMFSVAFPLELKPGWSMAPHMDWSRLLNSELEDYCSKKSCFNAGLDINWELPG